MHYDRMHYYNFYCNSLITETLVNLRVDLVSQVPTRHYKKGQRGVKAKPPAKNVFILLAAYEKVRLPEARSHLQDPDLLITLNTAG